MLSKKSFKLGLSKGILVAEIFSASLTMGDETIKMSATSLETSDADILIVSSDF